MGRPRPVLGVDPEVIIQIGDDFKKFPWVDATAGVFEGSALKPTPPSDHIPLGRRCADHRPVLIPRAICRGGIALQVLACFDPASLEIGTKLVTGSVHVSNSVVLPAQIKFTFEQTENYESSNQVASWANLASPRSLFFGAALAADRYWNYSYYTDSALTVLREIKRSFGW
jgi:hypothetical protein